MTDKFDFSEAREDAKEIITEFGESSTLTKPGDSGGYDAFGNPIADTPGTTINGTVTPLLNYKIDEIDGETIQRQDSYVFFDTDGTPEIGMNITINGQKYAVVDIPLRIQSVGGVTVLNKLQLRR